MKNIIKNTNKKGFTIVELVIVIAVIAILAGVLIPTFANVIENAKKRAAEQEAQIVYKEIYAVDLSDGALDGMLNGVSFKKDKEDTNGNIVDFGTLGITYKGAVTTYNIDATTGKLTTFKYKIDKYTVTYTVTTSTWEVA